MKNLKLFVRNIKRYFSYAMYSAKSELKADVINSYLNWFWWILEPICMMLIYIFIVEVVFKSKEENFPVFVFIGITVWNYFSKMLTVSVKLIKTKKQILARVYLPKYILVLENSFIFTFKAMISFVLILLLMILFKMKYSLYLLMFPIIYILLYILTFGICCIIMHFGTYIQDLVNILTIVLKFLLYFSGIFYNIRTRLTSPLNNILININPIAFIIDAFREIFMYETFPSFGVMTIWLFIGLSISYIGILLIHKYEGNYTKVI